MASQRNTTLTKPLPHSTHTIPYKSRPAPYPLSLATPPPSTRSSFTRPRPHLTPRPFCPMGPRPRRLPHLFIRIPQHPSVSISDTCVPPPPAQNRFHTPVPQNWDDDMPVKQYWYCSEAGCKYTVISLVNNAADFCACCQLVSAKSSCLTFFVLNKREITYFTGKHSFTCHWCVCVFAQR